MKIRRFYPAYKNRLDSLEMSFFYGLPIITLSGFIKSLTAVPYAKNSGLLATVYFTRFC